MSAQKHSVHVCVCTSTYYFYSHLCHAFAVPNGNPRAMQFFALMSNFTGTPLGLYVGSHDPKSRLQLLLLEGLYKNEQGCTNASVYAEGYPGAWGRAALQWHHFPDEMKVDLSTGASYSMPYAVVLEGFAGNWFDAAQIYRAWAIKDAVWTQQGTLAERVARGDYPQWLLDTHLWYPTLSASNMLLRFAET